jgi:hypothetical protein
LSKLNKGHGNELAQWNVHSRFLLGIDIEFLQDLIGVEFVLALDPLDYIFTRRWNRLHKQYKSNLQ